MQVVIWRLRLWWRIIIIWAQIWLKYFRRYGQGVQIRSDEVDNLFNGDNLTVLALTEQEKFAFLLRLKKRLKMSRLGDGDIDRDFNLILNDLVSDKTQDLNIKSKASMILHDLRNEKKGW